MLKVRIETMLAVLCAALAGLTVVWPPWIETIVRVEPDGGSGETEWLIVIALSLLALGAALLARRHYLAARRLWPDPGSPLAPER